jgi:hypothetical protein
MGHEDNGFTRQNLVYAAAESRPENPPALVLGGEIQIIDENDSSLYLVTDFVKSWPATNTWSLVIEDAEGNSIKNVLNGLQGTSGPIPLTFDVQNDYESARLSFYVGGTLTAPPQIASFDAFLVSADEVTLKERRVPVRIIGIDCFEGGIFTQDRTTDQTSEPANTYPIVVDVGEFVASDGGFTWEASLDQITWGESVSIATQPANDEYPSTANAIPVYLRALLPCPVDIVTQLFVRHDPS